MSRKVVRLTAGPPRPARRGPVAPCTTCLFWQLDPVSRDRVAPDEAAAEKEAWVSHVLREWGSCGRVVLVDEQPVGYAIYAPAGVPARRRGVPDRAGLPGRRAAQHGVGAPRPRRRRARPDAGAGDGPRPGQARRHRGGRGVRRHPRPGPARRCVVPADFLGSVGFKTHRPHGTTPRMRMDLRTALTWRTEVEAALERLVGAVRPRPAQRGPAVTRTEPVAARTGEPRPSRVPSSRRAAQAMKSASSLSSVALGRAPTIDFTTSPSL